jgi:hypothetical protein
MMLADWGLAGSLVALLSARLLQAAAAALKAAEVC